MKLLGKQNLDNNTLCSISWAKDAICISLSAVTSVCGVLPFLQATYEKSLQPSGTVLDLKGGCNVTIFIIE